MTRSKRIAAFFIAPPVAPIVFWLLNAMTQLMDGQFVSDFSDLRSRFSGLIFYLLAGTPIAYILALVLGLPGEIYMRKEGKDELHHYQLLGAAVGVTPLLILGLFTGSFNEGMALEVALSGAMVGTVYWKIAVDSSEG